MFSDIFQAEKKKHGVVHTSFNYGGHALRDHVKLQKFKMFLKVCDKNGDETTFSNGCAAQ